MSVSVVAFRFRLRMEVDHLAKDNLKPQTFLNVKKQFHLIPDAMMVFQVVSCHLDRAPAMVSEGRYHTLKVLCCLLLTQK